MPDSSSPILRLVLRYGGAVLAVAAATGLRWLLQDLFGSWLAFITYYPALTLVALFAGGGPGVLVTVLTTIIVSTWIYPPFGIGSAHEALATGLFTTSGLTICAMAEMLHRAWRREAAGLEAQVAERTARLEEANDRLRQEIAERRQAEEALRESEQRLHLMADALPVLISYIDADCRYQFNNACYERWFGLPHNACKGRHMREVLGEAAYDAVQEHVEAVLAGQPRTFEARVPYQTAGTRDVLVSYVPHQNQDGKVLGFYALILDLSERKRAEEALRDSEARLRAILETAVDAIITIDERGTVESVNPATEKLFGYTAAEMLGQNVKMLMPSPYHEQHDDYLANYLSTGVKRIIGIGREVQGRRKDGSVFPVELAVSEVWDGGRWFTGVLHDLSQRKALEREVLEIAAQEQQRIGQELHDSVGQELTGLGLMAGALARRLEEGVPAERDLAGKLAQGLTRVHQQVRDLCRGLILIELDAEGLQVALEDLAAQTHERSSIACRLDCPEPVPVPDLVTAKHLYRIAQEAVSNALRHGRPQNIWLALRSGPEGVRLSIQDDGTGVPDLIEGHKGMGIPTMRYRAGMIGGTLQIGPANGRGTLVTCNVPRRTSRGDE